MNKKHKKIDISKMTEFKPSQTVQHQDDFDPSKVRDFGKERDMKKEMHEDLEGNKQMVKSFNLID
jgi:xylose isomerase